VTVLQLVRGPTSARLRSALGRWNPVEQTGLCIYSCFRIYRLELFNRVLSNQLTIFLLSLDSSSLLSLSSLYIYGIAVYSIIRPPCNIRINSLSTALSPSVIYIRSSRRVTSVLKGGRALREGESQLAGQVEETRSKRA
jgi:hypothetical protein